MTNTKSEKNQTGAEERMLSDMITGMPDAAFAVDRNWNITVFNQAAEELTGHNVEEAIGMKVSDVFNTTKIMTHLKSAKKDDKRIKVDEMTIMNRDDDEISCEFIAQPLKDENGKVDGALGFLKPSNTIVRLKEQYLEGIATPVLAIDKNFNIQYANKHTALLLGRSVEECIGKKCYDMFNTDHCQTKDCAVGQAMESRKPVNAETVSKPGKDKTLFISYTGSPVIDANGDVIGGIEYVVDSTNQRLLMDEYKGQVDGINKAQAVIEFNPDGTIIRANELFLSTIGYSENEIKGHHHSMFVEQNYKNSAEYRMFWEKLNRGEAQVAEFKRFGKGGKEIWLQASYTPIKNMDGKVFKIVKYATDVTHQKLMNSDFDGQIKGINATQAVIEFNPDGTIIRANELFLSTIGYSENEIKGHHHSMFVEQNYKNSAEYRMFWEKLNRGEAQVAEFKRFGKGGKEIWLQASYTPIKNMDGKVFKIVKYATDVTEQKLMNSDFEGQIKGINETQAVIEFNPDGTIIRANTLFLSTIGYSEGEIKGHHHSMFVEQNYKNSPEYKQFWAALNQGQPQSGEFMRFGKGGKEVWLQATYTPIKNMDGKVFKVVKYASDITSQKQTIFGVAKLIKAAKMGQLSERIEIGDTKGDYRDLRQGVNELLDSIIGPLNVAAETVQRIANGDLTEKITDHYEGDFNNLKNSLNECIENLQSLVMEIQTTAEIVASTSQELASSAEEMNASTEQVSSAIQQISKGSQTQAGQVEQTAKIMKDMAATVEDVANRSQAASDAAKNTSMAAESGKSAVEDTMSKMGDIQKHVSFSAEIIATLGKRSEEIGQIVDVITNIADQTNMLALNAAIEAARAGDQGRGFAVVAEEVKNLAEDSREAANRISKMIKEIQKETGNAVDGMKKGTTSVEEGMNVVQKASTSLLEITDMARASSDEVNAITAATQQQKAGTENVAKSIDSIASVSEETASASEESASSTEELTASMEDMTARAQELSEMAINLQNSASRFRLDESVLSMPEELPRHQMGHTRPQTVPARKSVSHPHTTRGSHGKAHTDKTHHAKTHHGKGHEKPALPDKVKKSLEKRGLINEHED